MEKPKKYITDDLNQRERIVDSHKLLEKWARTHNRVCPITGRDVTLDDVERGMYHLVRRFGNAAYGYETYPTEEWLMEIMKPAVFEVLSGKFRKEFLQLVQETDDEIQRLESFLIKEAQ
jgi:hypothetical protein